MSNIIEQKMKTLENLNITQATISKTDREKNEVLDEFTKLNLRLTKADPTPITAVELLKDITEVESWLPQDERYEQLKNEIKRDSAEVVDLVETDEYLIATVCVNAAALCSLYSCTLRL